MTAGKRQQPQMSVEGFEQLERHAPETVRLEFIKGKVQVKRAPDGNHSEIVAGLQRVCMQHLPDLSLDAERGLKTESCGKGRARADGVLVSRGGLKGHGQWSDTGTALMAVEVTSWDVDAAQRDRFDKPDGYAAAGIPVYVLIDRDDRTVTVFTHPEGGQQYVPRRGATSFRGKV
ncbi:Uma2 family endonuclease [Streptomyces sp. NBC_01261]|uniref:Uma2 family endonuclease n=1 Tax=Streptomyces sp. NBC_01261 TaxID=2903802 RepID=UPI002E355AAD|nr:Uma2 family endonuclease [Streptomyces sp. NBC_01261]